MGRRGSLAGSAALALLLALVGGCARDVEIEPADGTPPPVEVRSGVDRAVATTGDLITYRIEVEHAAGYEVRLPEVGAEIAGFRIVDTGAEPPRQVGGRQVIERWYRLRADLVGSYVLPPVRVAYRPAAETDEGAAELEAGAGEAVVETSPIFVEVESVLPQEGGAEEIRDIKPPRRVGPPLPWPWIVAAAAALAVLVGALLWRRRRGRPRVEPRVPPHELAFAALDRLRGTDFDDPAAVRRFHFAISETVRAYVEGRFGVNATDLTTEEIVTAIARLGGLESDERRRLARFLADTDLVKFADREPSRAEIEATYERALGFVEATRPRSEEEREAAAEAPRERAA